VGNPETLGKPGAGDGVFAKTEGTLFFSIGFPYGKSTN